MTQAPSSHVQVEIFPQAVVATLTDGYIIDDVVIDTVGKALYGLVERDGQIRLVIDFSQVRFLSSALLVKLFRLRELVQQRRGTLKLCGISADVLRLFKLFPKHGFDIYESEEEALDSF
jgi:anti-anti-sigma factor